MTQPTFLRVGIPKTKARAIGTVRPPTTPATATLPLSEYSFHNTTGTPHTINLPNYVIGDVVWMVLRHDSGTWSVPSGWTNGTNTTTFGTQLRIIYKVMDGTEGTTVSITSSSNTEELLGFVGIWQANGFDYATTPPEFAGWALGDNGWDVDPPAFTPSTAGTYYTIAGYISTENSTIGAAPTGYTDIIEQELSTPNLSGAVAYKLVNIVTSEDPGTGWVNVGTARWGAAFTFGFLESAAADLATGDHTHTETDVTDLTHHVIVGGFGEDNLAASLTDSQLYRQVQASQQQTPIVMPYAGSILGISVASSEARTAGTATFEVFKNATGTGLTTVLDATDTQYAYATQAADLDTFAAGDRLDVRVTTDGSWAPTTADVEAVIYTD